MCRKEKWVMPLIKDVGCEIFPIKVRIGFENDPKKINSRKVFFSFPFGPWQEIEGTEARTSEEARKAVLDYLNQINN
jgi:hypothetical protein